MSADSINDSQPENEQKGQRGQANKDMSQMHETDSGDQGDETNGENSKLIMNKLNQAMSSLTTNSNKQQQSSSSSTSGTTSSILGGSKQKKKESVEKMTLNKEDIDLLMNEMAITKELAEQSLRLSKGNVTDALYNLIHA